MWKLLQSLDYVVVPHDLPGVLLEIVDKSSLCPRKTKTQGLGWEIIVQTLLLEVFLSRNPGLNLQNLLETIHTRHATIFIRGDSDFPPHGLPSDLPLVLVFAANPMRPSSIKTVVSGAVFSRSSHLRSAQPQPWKTMRIVFLAYLY